MKTSLSNFVSNAGLIAELAGWIKRQMMSSYTKRNGQFLYSARETTLIFCISKAASRSDKKSVLQPVVPDSKLPSRLSFCSRMVVLNSAHFQISEVRQLFKS